MAIDINIPSSIEKDETNAVGFTAGKLLSSDGTKLTEVDNPNLAKLNTIVELQAYDGDFESVTVSDLQRGGTFIYKPSGYTNDGCVVFTATGKGSGFWVRQRENDEVNLKWADIDLTGATDNSTIVQAIIDKYSVIRFPSGTIQAGINNTKSNRTFISQDGCIIDGGVIHLAIGDGPSVSPLNPYSIVENVKWIGKLTTTSRVGTYYCKNVSIDEIEIVAGAYVNPARGVHFHFGTQNLYVGKIKSVAEVGGDYGLGINGGSGVAAFDEFEITKDVYIGSLIIDSDETGVSINKVKNMVIDQVVINSWGNTSSSHFGLVSIGATNCRIGSLFVDGQFCTGATAYQISINASDDFQIEKTTSVNAPFEGVTLIAAYTGPYYTNEPNKNLVLTSVLVKDSKKTGFKLGGTAAIDNISVESCNNTGDANASQIYFNASTNIKIGKIQCKDALKVSNAISGINANGISIDTAVIEQGGTFGVYLQGTCQNVSIKQLRVSSCTQNVRYEATTSNITIEELISLTPSLRDVTNLAATNVRIGFRGGILFLAAPYQYAGFTKIGNEYRSAIPTTGAHYIGHIYYNSAPASAGFIGWVCTANGTPGTWKTFGLIS